MALPLAISACAGPSDDETGPGGVTQREADELNQAADEVEDSIVREVPDE